MAVAARGPRPSRRRLNELGMYGFRSGLTAGGSLGDRDRTQTIVAGRERGPLAASSGGQRLELAHEAADDDPLVRPKLLPELSGREEIRSATGSATALDCGDDLGQHRKARGPDAAFRAVDLHEEPVPSPVCPAGVQGRNVSGVVPEYGEAVVLAPVELPHIARREAGDLGHVAEKVSGEVDQMNAVVAQHAAPHDGRVVQPGLAMRSGRVACIATNVIKVTD